MAPISQVKLWVIFGQIGLLVGFLSKGPISVLGFFIVGLVVLDIFLKRIQNTQKQK